ncbi:MAG: cyclic peptide export ABC transporter [Cyclobacteriaceae bacterium]
MKLNIGLCRSFLLIACLLVGCGHVLAQENITSKFLEETGREIEELMEEGDIPGLSVVYIEGNEQVIKTFGYSDLEEREKTTSKTLFEIGSCTKAFTGLAITQLLEEGKISKDQRVSDFIPWWNVTYEGEVQDIKIHHLLYHTSGIPWNSISKIPAAKGDDALAKTIRTLENLQLNSLPGTTHEYATINYDVLALILEKVTGQSYEEYLQQQIIDPLSLTYTSVGNPIDTVLFATGYKNSFFKPRKYEAPVFRGNYAAGYVISNAEDMAKWIKFQLGIRENELSQLLPVTHQRDETVALHGMSSYARGWEIRLDGTGEIYHGGYNPNYTSYIAFVPDKNIGVAVLANSNSEFTQFIGDILIKKLGGYEVKDKLLPGDRNDTMFSGISCIAILYILIVVFYLIKIFSDIANKKRSYSKPSAAAWRTYILTVLFILPFMYGGYELPRAIAGFDWDTIMVWSPESFLWMMRAILFAIIVSYIVGFVNLMFPDTNKYRQAGPQIILISILSGFANVVVIMMVTSGIDSDQELKYQIFYYGLVLAVYLAGRRYVQIQLIRLTRGLIYDLNVRLIDKVFSTSFQNFEKIERGRIYATFNDDINIIGQSTNVILTLITSIITALGAFIYLATIADWATAIVLGLIVSLATLYYFVGQSTNKYYEKARDSRTVFMNLFNGMVDGFKELSLHRNKKVEYKDEISESAGEFRDRISHADVSFVNAFLVGESLLVILLGFVAFGMKEIFPELPYSALISFVVILLYLINPINGILGSVPQILRLKVSWKRVNQFIGEIPANVVLPDAAITESQSVEKMETVDLEYNYYGDGGDRVFGIGPINLSIDRGMILFIIGGNGSGKTTLAKMLTGLYSPESGHIEIDGNTVSNSELSENYSTVFANPYLFNKLYNVQVEKKQQEIDKYLKLLNLDHKVRIENGEYSTINLSGGQRKRLALLQCYLEDRPIYLFDEWAADQDPEYRHFFYRTLLPEMRKAGKIIIAITHDDHYFDVADKVMKMDQGKLDLFEDKSIWTEA